MDLYTRLQAYCRKKEERGVQELIAVPPFVLMVHEMMAWAIPTQNADEAGIQEAITTLRSLCKDRNILLQFDFVREFIPALERILLDMGMVQNVYQEWMICTPDMLREPQPMPGLTFVTLSSDSPFEEVREGWNANALGFDPNGALGTDEEIEQFRQSLITSRAFTARLEGKPVGSGMFGEIYEGVTALLGISTLEGYRRRGIGGVVTASIARAAFDAGCEVIYLVAANDEARRLYERLGFMERAHVLEYRDER